MPKAWRSGPGGSRWASSEGPPGNPHITVFVQVTSPASVPSLPSGVCDSGTCLCDCQTRKSEQYTNMLHKHPPPAYTLPPWFC